MEENTKRFRNRENGYPKTVGKGHPILVIIVQPGSHRFEGNCPGLFYVFLSCATDIGNKDDRSTSAIFFHTEGMNNNRITDLLLGADGREYKRFRNGENGYVS